MAIAIIGGMMKIRMIIRVRQGKVNEFLQHLESLANTLRGFEGCESFLFHFLDDVSDIDLLIRFSSRRASDAYLTSREHRALLGAAVTLGEHHTLTIQGSPEEKGAQRPQ